MKVLITGAAGFIGSHLANKLYERGHDVVAIDDLSGGFKANINPAIKFIEKSICDKSLEDTFLSEKPEIVHHLAAYAAEGLSPFIRAFNYDVNLVGTARVLNATVNCNARRLVFASSIAAYGSLKPPFTEEMTPHPEDPYGIAKYACELDIQAAVRSWGIEAVILRPHNVYGENQNISDMYRNVVALFARSVLTNKPMRIFGDGNQKRCWTHIDDLVKNFIDATERSHIIGVFNVGTDEVNTVNSLAQIFQDIVPGSTIEYVPARDEVYDAVSDHTRALQTFGPATISLYHGIERYITYLRKNKELLDRKPEIFGNIEVLRGLPSVWA
jgi:UDP-glucose 4-epimerase